MEKWNYLTLILISVSLFMMTSKTIVDLEAKEKTETLNYFFMILLTSCSAMAAVYLFLKLHRVAEQELKFVK